MKVELCQIMPEFFYFELMSERFLFPVSLALNSIWLGAVLWMLSLLARHYEFTFQFQSHLKEVF